MPRRKAETVVRQVQKRRKTRDSSKTKTVEQQSTTVDTGVKRNIGEVTDDTSELDIRPIKITEMEHDKYCFTCHKLGQELQCASCPRSFHEKCLSSSKVFDENNDCYLCRQVKSTREDFSRMPFSRLSQKMMVAVRLSFPDNNRSDKVTHLTNEAYITWPSDKKVAYVADWDTIIDKCRDYNENHYYSPVEILPDVMWLHHNCIITYGEHSTNTKKAKQIVERAQAELKDLIACQQCYGNKDSSFTNICKPPHCIVWVKVKGFPYWPAKVLDFDDGRGHVKFFNNYQSSFRVRDVLYITKQFPPKGQKPTSSKLILAIEELQEYVRKFEGIYGSGSFPYKDNFRPYNFEAGKKEILKIHKKVFKPVKDPKILEKRRKRKGKHSKMSTIIIDLTAKYGKEKE